MFIPKTIFAPLVLGSLYFLPRLLQFICLEVAQSFHGLLLCAVFSNGSFTFILYVPFLAMFDDHLTQKFLQFLLLLTCLVGFAAR